MHYLNISYTHKNTPLDIREKLAFNDEDTTKQFYEKILSLKEINELLIISTCNRVEFLASVNSIDNVATKIVDQIIEHHKLMPYELEEVGDIFKDVEAVYHIFKVISSLDSVVIGETQIVGQVKDAFSFSYENGYSGKKIARVMHNAFRCSATVRSQTKISKNPVSVASVAVSKAKEIFGGNLGGYTGVVIGVGEMGELVVKHLANSGANIILINRDLQKANQLAKEIKDVSVIVEPFSKLKKFINHYRLLFCATGATTPIITKDMVDDVTFHREWFDIAVPRDIEDAKYDNISIHTVDDLKGIMDANIKLRENSAKDALEIVVKFTEEFFSWLQTLSVDPLIKEIRALAREASKKEIEKAIKKGYIDASIKNQVEKIVHQSFNSFLHHPTQKLKKISNSPQSDTVVQSIQLFFDLHTKQRKAIDVYKCVYQIEKDLKDKN